MFSIQTFTFNPYQENTYVLYNGSGQCIIVDPGMYTNEEKSEFLDFLTERQLTPTILLNTHCHIDHVLGNNFIYEEFGLLAQFHEGEIPVLIAVQNYAPQYGFHYHPAPIAETFLTETDSIALGDDILRIILAPGHSPASICFYSQQQNFLIGGDVLFKNSIGRTDLPGGNHQQLLESIRKNIYTLPDNTTVYPGHGPTTMIGLEKQNNPFVRA